MGLKSPHSFTGAVGKRKVVPPAEVMEKLEQAHMTKVRELARDYTERAVAVLVDVAEDEQYTASARVAAAKAILEFGWGKPTSTEKQGIGGGGGLTINIVRFGSDGEARRLEKVIDVPAVKVSNDLIDLEQALLSAEQALQEGMGGE